jgi:hypothetical protein
MGDGEAKVPFGLNMSLDQIIENSSSSFSHAERRGRGRGRFGAHGVTDNKQRNPDQGHGGRGLRVAVPIDMKQRGTPRGG